MPDLASLRTRLGLPDDTSDEDVIAAVESKLPAQAATTAPAAPASADPTAVAPVVSLPVEPAPVAQAEKVAASVADQDAVWEQRLAAALNPVMAQLTSVTTELAARKAAEAVTTRETVIAAAILDGKIKPADRELYEQQYDEAPQVTTRILAAMAPGTAVAVHAAGRTGSAEQTADEIDQAFWASIQPGVSFGG